MLRFIVNVPEEELVSFERICFQIEQAYWFYVNFYLNGNPPLPKYTLKDFAYKVFQHTHFLTPYVHETERIS